MKTSMRIVMMLRMDSLVRFEKVMNKGIVYNRAVLSEVSLGNALRDISGVNGSLVKGWLRCHSDMEVFLLGVGKKKKMKWSRKMKMKRMLKVKRVWGGSCGQYGMSPVEKEDGRMMMKKKRTMRMIKYQRG
eukprot:scaffold4968_cov53-Attheya_sp.AAC.1